MTKFTNEELANLSGAYVLDALEPDEARAFEEALAESDQARYEVTELRDTAVLLGLATAPVEPSAALRAKIMAQVAVTPQQAAAESDVETSGEESDHEISRQERQETIREFELPSKAAAKAQTRWFTRPAVVLTSMAAALALIVGGVATYNGIADSQYNQAMADRFAAISTASDSERVTTDVATGGTATIVWSPELASAAVKVDGVQALPADKVYELWYIDIDGARPAGTFSPSDGSGWRALDGPLKTGDTIGVTIEPAGGSDTPTTAPIVAITTA